MSSAAPAVFGAADQATVVRSTLASSLQRLRLRRNSARATGESRLAQTLLIVLALAFLGGEKRAVVSVDEYVPLQQPHQAWHQR